MIDLIIPGNPCAKGRPWNPNPQKASDEQLINSYSRTKSIYKTANEFSMCPQSIHERLTKLGKINKLNIFSEEDKAKLLGDYEKYANAGKLQELALEMKRTKNFICRQAKTLGLTNRGRPMKCISTWKYIDEIAARKWMDKFKKSSLGLGKFCHREKIDDLGFMKTMRKFFPDEYEHVIESKTPRQTPYRIGRAFEYQIRDLLKLSGYFVLRSPASKSPVDLVAIKIGEILLIQCKRGGSLCVSEWNELFSLANSLGAIPILAEKPDYRGYILWKIIGPKDGTKKPQPRVNYEIN